MSLSNKIPTEKKLAGIITGLISLVFLSLLFFYNIVIPINNEITKPSSGITEITYINDEGAVSLDGSYEGKSLSTTLPSGITASVVKIETELFRNSFISSLQSNIKKHSVTNLSAETEMPGKAPNQNFGESRSTPRDLKETSFIGGNLKNRKLLFIDNIKGTTEEGCVVVKLSVNSKGEVTNAEVDPGRTTSSSSSLRSKALKTSLTAVFEPSSSSKEQTGFITFKFEY